MKKFGKFLFGTVSIATLACGAYYVYKNLINKDSSDEFDEFEDGFEDFETEDEDSEKTDKKETREYVSINITSEGSDKKVPSEDITEDDSSEENEYNAN